MNENSAPELFTTISYTLEGMLSPRGFKPTEALPPDKGAMGGWFFKLESPEFVITASQDRTGDILGICVGSKVRIRRGAHMRGPWSLGHLRGYRDGLLDHYLFSDAAEQLDWLADNLDCLLDTSFLNSDELNEWAVRTSRRMFAQDPV